VLLGRVDSLNVILSLLMHQHKFTGTESMFTLDERLRLDALMGTGFKLLTYHFPDYMNHTPSMQ
jgi:hypothetical protein